MDRFRPGLRVCTKRAKYRSTKFLHERGWFDAGIYEVVINSPDGIKAFAELTAGAIKTFHAFRQAARSRRGIPDKKINRIRITMNDEIIAQPWNTAGIPWPQAFAGAGVAKGFPAEPGGYCTLYRIRIHSCRSGCFP
jgi:hypothetical protein